MKSIPKLILMSLFILVFCASSSALADSFSADMVTTIKGKSKTGKFYLSGSHYRMETTEDGKPTVIIVDREKNIQWKLDVKEKAFYKIASNDINAMTDDPFKTSEYMLTEYENREEDTRKINGMDCEKKIVLEDNKIIHASWISKQLNFPIKLVSYYNGKEYYVYELKNIRQGNLPKKLFKPPADFKQKEDPVEARRKREKQKEDTAAAEKGKHEKQKKTEEAIPGLTEVDRVHVPCFVKIAAGGELHIQVNTNGAAYLEMMNQAKDASEFTLLKYRNGKPNEAYDEETAMFEKKGGSRILGFNEKTEQKEPSLLVDEVVIKVNKGLVYAHMVQFGADRKDYYNYGGHHSGAHHAGAPADPNRPLTVQITGDNPFYDQTSGEFYLQSESEDNSELVPFTVENGKTLTWDYPAGKKVKNVEVRIDAGNGRAKISVIQPPGSQKHAAKKPAVKKNAPAKRKKEKTPVTKDIKTESKASQQKKAAPVKASKPFATGKTIYDGKVPLMEDARVVKEVALGPMKQVDVEVSESAEAVISFYKNTMANMGWKAGVSTVQGDNGMIQLLKERSLLTIKTEKKGQKTVINMVLMSQ